MLLHRALVVAVCLVPACKKDSDADKKDEDKAEAAEADAEKKKSDSANAGDSATGSQAADSEGEEIPADCPGSLSGRESTDRVIPSACKTVEITGNYSIDGATLTIEPGVTLAFRDDALLSIGYFDNAKLEIKGTKEKPVTFTSSGDDVAGVWKGVRLHGKANRSVIEGLVIEYSGDRDGALKIDANDVEVRNSVFRHARKVAVVVDRRGTLADFSGNTFEEVGDVAMRVTPTVAGQIGEGNAFGDAKVHVLNGRIERDSTWGAIGTPFAIVGAVDVDGADGTRATLTLDPGTTLRFDADGALRIGRFSLAGLRAQGKPDAPILLTAHEKSEPGSWDGVQIHGRGEAKLQYVKFEYGGSNTRHGVLQARSGSKLAVEHCTFSSNRHGIVLDGREPELEAFDANTFEDTPVALQLPARSMGVLGSENTYSGEPRIVITGGTVDQDATWRRQKGATVVVDKPVAVSATLELEAGSVLHMADGARITVGQFDTASLRAQGTQSDPIAFVGVRDDVGTWGSIVLHTRSGGSVLEHVLVRNAGGKAGVEVSANADAQIANLTCEKCQVAAVTWHRNARVETSDIKAGEGTPKAEAKP